MQLLLYKDALFTYKTTIPQVIVVAHAVAIFIRMHCHMAYFYWCMAYLIVSIGFSRYLSYDSMVNYLFIAVYN